MLILQEGYEGDVEAGDALEVTMPDGPARVQVATVAWGSAFHAESPPLTLVVEGLDADPVEGAAIRGPVAE